MQDKKSVLCAVVVSDTGDILPRSCQFTKEQVEEWAEYNLAWTRMKQLGAKIVQARLTLEEDI